MEKLKKFITGFAIAFGLLPIAAIASDTKVKALVNPVIIELFTSQGCSSCPPADALLNQLSNRNGVLGLSFHVDYWDYIGWKDPFASKVYTDRQKRYAKAFSSRYVYTPQIVVDGRLDAMGANKKDVFRCIGIAEKQMKLVLRRNNKGQIVFPEDRNGRNSLIWLVYFDLEHSTKVLKGENKGRVIVNSNVVRSIKNLGQWNGEKMTLPIPPSPTDGFVVIVQSARNSGHGPIRASYAELRF